MLKSNSPEKNTWGHNNNWDELNHLKLIICVGRYKVPIVSATIAVNIVIRSTSPNDPIIMMFNTLMEYHAISADCKTVKTPNPRM